MTEGVRKRIEVVAAAIVDAGRVLATQRGRGEWAGRWEFPGGKVEPSETATEALGREIREELAVEIDVGTRLTTIDYDYPTFHLTMHVHRCTIHAGHPTLTEHLAARWLTRGELHTVSWLPADERVIEHVARLL